MLGDPERGGRLGVDAQREGLEALEQHPRVERAERRARVPDELLDRPLDVLLGAEDRTAEDAALAVDVLRGGVDDHVGAERERLLEDGRREDVVEDDDRTGGVGELADPPHVDDVLHGVRRRLEEDDVRRSRERRLPLVGLVTVDVVDDDAPVLEDLLEDDDGRPEESARGDDTRPRLHERGERGEDGGHAGRRRVAGLGPVEQAQALLEHVHRGVAVAGVDEAVDLALERGLGLGAGAVDVALGEEDRLRGLLEVRADLPAADGEGRGAQRAARAGRGGRVRHRAHSAV